ncbi:MAG: tandem-95 repeat protein [Planctomycetes bacterium]|nr:tandem-95 repeat protein [Planctomycetota bacterium]
MLSIQKVALLCLLLAPGAALAATAPVANNQSTTISEGVQRIYINLAYSDPDTSGTYTFRLLTAPTKGKLEYYHFTVPYEFRSIPTGVAMDNGWYYTPNAGFSGIDTFTWTVSDGTYTSNTATCNITVKKNTVPVANNQAISVLEGTYQFFNLSYSDPDSGQVKTFTMVTPPVNGTVTYNGAVLNAGASSTSSPSNWKYTPNTGFAGTDAFTWKVSDGVASSGTATCTITVNRNSPPIVTHPTYSLTVLKDSTTLVSNYLHYTHVDVTQPVNFILVEAPAKGELKNGTTILKAGDVTSAAFLRLNYTPMPGYLGADSFRWKVNDGMIDSAIGTLAINVVGTSAPGAPPALKAGVPIMDGAAPLRVWRSERNGRYDYANREGNLANSQYEIFSMAAPELADWNNDGLTDLLVGQADGRIALFLNKGSKGSPRFSGFQYLSYLNGVEIRNQDPRGCSCSGGEAACAAPRFVDWNADGLKDLVMGTWGDQELLRFQRRWGVTVCLNVGTNEAPAFAEKIWCLLSSTLPKTGYNGGGRPSAMPFITDINGDGFPDLISGDNNVWSTFTARYIAQSTPSGLVNVFLGARMNHGPDPGTILTFTSSAGIPARAYECKGSFFYPQSTALGIFPTLTLSNASPVGSRKSVVAVDLSGSGRKDLLVGMQDGTVWFSPNVGSSKCPVFGSPARLNAGGTPIVVGDPAKVGTDKDYRNSTGDYHSAPSLQPVNEAQLGVGDLDGDGLTDLVVGDVKGYVTFFQGHNPKPVAIGQKVIVTPGKPKPITLQARVDSGKPVTFSVTVLSTHGTLTGTAPDLIYTPAAGYVGMDSFTFKVSDGTFTDSGIINIEVKATAPVAQGLDVPLVVTRNTPRAIQLKVTNEGDEPLTYSVVVPPAHGTLSGTAPNLIYTPSAGYMGLDSFTFKANDGFLDSNLATIPLEVIYLGVNFQAATSAVPPGYLMDAGGMFDTGRKYGWDINLTGNAKTYERETDPRVDSAVSSQALATWKTSLPNGSYYVSLGIGSTVAAYDQDRAAVQGQWVLDRAPKGFTPALTLLGNVPASVADGELRVTIGGGTFPTRLDYLEIRNQKRQAGWATFVTEDSTTQGNWKGRYGTDGHWIVNNSKKLPNYASNFDPYVIYKIAGYTWADPSTDARALQHAWDINPARIASGWAASTTGDNILLNLKLHDGLTHRVAVYFLDWGGDNTRSQRVEVVDGEDPTMVLDSRAMASFVGGKYLVWDLKGHVLVRLSSINKTARASAVFFGATNSANPPVLTTILLTPGSASVTAGSTQQFAAMAKDQYGANLSPQPAFTWAASGGGTINSAGLFTAGAAAGGPYTVTASAGGKNGQGSVTVTVPDTNSPPVIESAPWASPNPVTLPSSTSVNVVANDPDSGPAALTYTWSKVSGPGTVIFSPNGTASSSVSTATFGTAGIYTLRVGVSDGAATVTGDVTVSVNAALIAPAITTQPASVAVTAGQAATFNVTATGTAPLSYQWRKNGTAISGATNSSYTTPATTTADHGALFSVVVSNSAGSVTSANATLTVNSAAVAPAITSQPVSVAVTAGQAATFNVTATGTAPLSYQWRKNGVNIANATSAGYTTPVTTAADSGALFSVVVSNSAGSVTSSNATLTVRVMPAITTQPASVAVTAGQNATFNVTATGTAPLSYQWRKNGTAIAGATNSSYTTPATTTADHGALFSVVVSNSAGSVTSANATLTVTSSPASAALAAYLKLDESGGTVAMDSSGNGRNGTLSGGPAWAAGKIDGGLAFDEVDDRVALADFNYAPSGSFSLAFWFNVPSNGGAAYKYLFSHGGVGTPNSLNVYLFEGAQGTSPVILRTCLMDADDTLQVEALDVSLPLADGQWHHYALAVNSAGSTIYVDGVARKTSAKGGGSFNPAGNILLGARNDLDPARFFGGRLDDLRLYAGTLSAGDVIAIMAPLVVDNKDGNTSRTGTWSVSAGANPYAGESLYSDLGGTFRWTPAVTAAGTYEVYAWWTYHANRSTTVPYRIAHVGSVATVTVNQRDSTLGGKWVLLGSWTFNAGTAAYVEVSSENGQASADAVRLVRK